MKTARLLGSYLVSAALVLLSLICFALVLPCLLGACGGPGRSRWM